MGLFSIFLHQKPDKFDTHKPIRRRRHRHRRYDSNEENNSSFSVDIGEAEPIKININNASKFVFLSDGPSSLCVRVDYDNNEDSEVVVVKWSEIQRDVNNRDHIASKAAKGIISVPIYRVKELFRHYNKFVSVGIRSYIAGQTLSSIITSMNDDDINSITLQVQGIVWELAKKQSPYFGHIQDGSLKSTTPIAYIRTRIFLDKLSGNMDSSDFVEQGIDKYKCNAVMCHGNLTPEHIIVDRGMVVGVVGWSQGDFVPEIYDRLKYYFRSDPTSPQCWNRKMSEVMSTAVCPRPSVEFVINTTTYLYKSIWRSTPVAKRHSVNRLWNAITTNYTLVNCISTAAETDSDSMSLSSLASWTGLSENTLLPDS